MIQKMRTRELDFIRGIAILGVLSYHFEGAPIQHPIIHALQAPGKLLGATGVDLFFVLSGFLVGGLLIKEYKESGKIDAKRFILRRGLKIWPAYYFYVLFQAIAGKHPLNTFLVSNLFHVQNYFGSSLSHTWTLSLEEHFYLLLAISLTWMAARHWSMVRILKTYALVMIGVTILRSITEYMGWPGASQYTHDRVDSLLMGVILAGLLHFYPETFERIASRKWLLCGITGAAIAFRAIVQDPVWDRSVGFTILYLGYAAFLLLAYRHSEKIRDLAAYRVIAWIGVYSYGIYLWHNSPREIMLRISAHYPDMVRWPLLRLSEVLAAIALGVISTHLVEWPFLRLRERFLPSRTVLFGGTQEATAGQDAGSARPVVLEGKVVNQCIPSFSE